eukprot:296913-Chlamydomonas_euryale.AAC.8
MHAPRAGMAEGWESTERKGMQDGGSEGAAVHEPPATWHMASLRAIFQTVYDIRHTVHDVWHDASSRMVWQM